MIYEVIGIEDVNYPSRNTGEIVVGTRLYLTYSSEKITGKGCEVVWLTGKVDVSDVEIGDTIKLFYNKFGKVDSFVFAEK